MTTDELRAKFEAWYPNAIGDVQPFECYLKGYASRDGEVEALQDALFQISVRLTADRESDMDDMSWHTDMMARAQHLTNVEAEVEALRKDAERWRSLVAENNKGRHGKFRICWLDPSREGFITTDGVSCDKKDAQAIVHIFDAVMRDESK